MVKAIKNIMREKGMASNLLHLLSEEERKKLQATLLNMFVDIKNVCESLDLDYTLIGGSVLGAIRHKGFIPWDDDLDMGLSREDWHVFKCHFPQLLGEKYIMEAPGYDGKDTKQLVAKIYLKDSEYIMMEEVNLPYHNCIYVDMFVIDNVSNNCIIYNFDCIVADILRAGAITMQEYKYPSPILRDAMCSSSSMTLYFYLRKIIGMLFSVFTTHKKLCDFFDAFVSRHKKKTRRLTNATGLKKYREETLDAELMYPTSRGEFCGIQVNLPCDTDAYLKHLYGDYMKLPPVGKRETHPIVKLTFPNNGSDK